MDIISVWYIFPLSIVISSISMFSGIGGAILFSPVLFILLGFSPTMAIFTGLFIEVFGFSSGIIGYLRKRAVEFRIVKQLLPFSIIFAVIGVFVARMIPEMFLLGILIALLLYLSFKYLYPQTQRLFFHPKVKIIPSLKECPDIPIGVKVSQSVGGFLLGMISSGLGEIQEYVFLKKLNLSIHHASATSVFLVATTALVTIVAHVIHMITSKSLGLFTQIAPVLIFAIPGVIIGAQVGVYLNGKAESSNTTDAVFGILFLVLAIFIATRIF
ncbi:MAG: putative membrane protein YfcA [Candidatus Woesearchaeota archaeon]|jgi:uncharacterized membrane protein YfcA